MTSNHDRKAHVLRCAAEILKDQTDIDGSIRDELDEIADRIESIAANLICIENLSC